jgi:hypothetical protein
MSLLTIVQQAFGEIGLPVPPTVVGNADVNVTKALAQVNRSGLFLRDAPGAADYWQYLRRQFLFNLAGQGPFTGTFTYGSPVITGVVFTGSGTGLSAVQPTWQVSSRYCLPDSAVVSVNIGAGTVTMNQNANTLNGSSFTTATDTALAFGQEAYPLPSDLNYFIPSTDWDRNFRWQLLGPVNAQEWQVLKSGISPVGPRIRYRLMQGMIYLNPSPFIQTGNIAPVTDLIVMEYCSQFWVAPTATPTVPSQVGFALDTDVCPTFPEDLLVLALKWRMLKSIGNAYAEEFDEYEKAYQQRQGRETIARNLPLNARAGSLRLLNSQQVPDTGFGS